MWSEDFEDISTESQRKRRKLEPKIAKHNTSTNDVEPICVDDLATHKKKIAEVKSCLESGLHSSSIHLLTGPTGSAKTVTLKVVAKSLGVQVQEWVNPVDKMSFGDVADWNKPEAYDVTAYCEPKQLDKFHDFAFRCSRYKTLFDSNQRRLLLVEDLPNHFIWNPSTFHDFLRKYSSTAKCPIVFIVTDDEKINLGHKLFPVHIRELYRVNCIKFNPVTNSALVKVLSKRAKDLDKESLKEISNAANGDIRTALSKLEFMGAGTRRTKRKSLVDKDVSVDFYHTLGRVLYPKKLEKISEDGRTFLYDIFTIANNYNNTFQAMLHENFLSTFSNLNDIIEACEMFSMVDILAIGGDELQKNAGVVCVAGLMLANKHVKKQFRAMGRSRWSGGTSHSLIGEKTRSYPHLPITPRTLNLDVLPYMKHLPSFTNTLTHSDADRLRSHVVNTRTASVFKAPLPPTSSRPPISADDESIIEEFDD